MERKIKTLNEVLNLNRRPTLQEMVDLSVEDYTKYLYYKGIIKYIPENIYEYKDPNDNDSIYFKPGCYYPEEDIILELKNPNGSERLCHGVIFDCSWDGYNDKDYILNETLKASIKNEYGLISGADKTEYIYKFSSNEDDEFYYIILKKDENLDLLQPLGL